MPEITIVTESELRQNIQLDKSLHDIIEQAFAELSRDQVIMPPVLSMELPQVHGEVDVKTAYIPGLDNFAIKISPGFFDNPSKGLPSLNGLMVTLDSRTGVVTSVLLDNGYLTDIRTAAAGGVVARHLAPRNTEVAGIIGTGLQARLQAQSLLMERPVKKLMVWGRDYQNARAYAEEMAGILKVEIEAVADAKTVVSSSQVVISTTPAKSPVILADWLHPGLHITAMGSDSPEKNELDPEILINVDRVIVDREQQSRERGELRTAIASGVWSELYNTLELGQICADPSLGRQSDDEITVCDLTGTGIQDTAIASFALEICRQQQAGSMINS
jgi:ectoine utilization protein EutC